MYKGFDFSVSSQTLVNITFLTMSPEAQNFLNNNTVFNVVDSDKLEVYKKQMQHAYMLKRLSLSFNQKALEGGDMMCLFVMIDTLIAK